jgi:hypothetical protein
MPPDCALAARFAIQPPIRSIAPLGCGLINATFCVTAADQQYVLQRINSAVFPAPAQIMANWRVLTAHVAAHGAGELRLPALIPARDGTDFVRDDAGDIWRMQELIAASQTLPQLTTSAQAREVGALLGRFHRITATLPPTQLGVTLPDFHATPLYLGRLLARDALPEFVAARRSLADVLATAQRTGQITQRVTHGDPKRDNILFTADGNRALALIDLDTVQPGLLHHDLGDCLRSCCNRTGEDAESSPSLPPCEKGGSGGIDEKGKSGEMFDLEICADILAGYGAETAGVLTAAECALLYDAIRLLPFELGIRFLTDHLEGDRYFRVSERGQNRHRAERQFALVAAIERQEKALRKLVRERLNSA